MTGLTLAMAVLASFCVLLARPARALGIYLVLLLVYPSYLVISLGTVDITAGRIVIAVLLAKSIFDKKLISKFRWCTLDTVVAVSMVIYVLISLVTQPFEEALENRGGFLMDTWFVYLATRFCITDRAALVTVTKMVAVTLIPLALLGMVEAYTNWNPFRLLTRYCPWREMLVADMRWGLYRATATFGNCIMFGVSLGIFLPLVYVLRHERGYWGVMAKPMALITLIGALSSMGSGPWLTAIVAVFCLIMERKKSLVKPLLISFLLGCVCVQIISNRNFYYVFADFANLTGGSGWHRARLIDVAIMHFDEWYVAGYGGKDPGWGPDLGGIAKTDITNEFILAGVNHGILGVLALCMMLIIAIRTLIRVYRSSGDSKLRSWCWALGSVFVAVIVTFMSVSFFGQPTGLFYYILGITAASGNLQRTQLGSITNINIGSKSTPRVDFVSPRCY